MALEAGSITNFTNNSMAKAIEDAFLSEWPNAMGGQPVPAINDQMRLMFVAVAQGVINHLNANPDAFKVTVSDGSNSYSGEVTSIQET
jgi:hypothetical protein